MFGYIRPRSDRLSPCDYERYKAAYCGLCKTLGRRFGFTARFFVNYDSVFLYFLLQCGNPEPENCSCICPACVFRKKRCYPVTPLMEQTAAKTVILCRHKLEDGILDEGFFKRLGFRFAKLLTARAYKKAKRAEPDFDRVTAEQLCLLRALEQSRSDSIDRTADAFATLLCACADGLSEPSLRRPAGQVLYHTGRFLYLCDALDDLAEDCKKDRYNVLRFRFSPENGKLNEEDTAYFMQLMDRTVSFAGAALELLPAGFGTAIAANTVYLGMPAVLQAIRQGTFQSRMKLYDNQRT